ncbi:MAG: hypothetical protein QM817_05205 [Archangium sp.]
MSKLTLIFFGALILIGWTTLAAGVIAVFEGEPTVSMQSHHHIEPPNPEFTEPGPLMSNDCPAGPGLDASVPCSA